MIILARSANRVTRSVSFLPFSCHSCPLLVIPAKAGIQTELMILLISSLIACTIRPSDTAFWIPVFTGMTINRTFYIMTKMFLYLNIPLIRYFIILILTARINRSIRDWPLRLIPISTCASISSVVFLFQ